MTHLPPVFIALFAALCSTAVPSAAIEPLAFNPVPVGFAQVATAGNTSGAAMLIDHPTTNANPAALAFVTASRSPGGVGAAAQSSPLGLLYDSGASRWAVVNQDQAAMPVGAAFNVQVAQDPSIAFVHTYDGADSFFTVIDNPLSNANPDALVFVTYNSSAAGGSVAYNDAPLGVFFSTDEQDQERWFIWNQNRADLPAGARFNVMVLSPGRAAFSHQATPANTSGSRTVLDSPGANNDPNAVIVVTQNWSPGGGNGAENPHHLGVVDDPATGRWSVFNEDGAAMPLDAAFNVSIYREPRLTYLPLIRRP